MKNSFGSDNFSGVHPKIMEALIEANVGHVPAYGHDVYTQRAQKLFRDIFGPESITHFVFNGTAANVLSMRTVLESFSAVITSDMAHIHVDECGAPESIIGCKILTVPSVRGKIYIEGIEKWMGWIGNQHHAQPRVVSISQSTEFGTVYSVKEVEMLANFAHRHGMYLHVDGARIANAVESLGCTPRELISDTNVDILSFGGTKNGMMYGEAVVFPKQELASRFVYIQKNSLQLCSKMRFIASQFIAMLENNLWIENAKVSNRMAKLLGGKLSQIDGVTLAVEVEANAVFATLPKECISPLQEHSFFYVWDESKNIVRFMMSFDTSEQDVFEFVAQVEKTLKQAKSPN